MREKRSTLSERPVHDGLKLRRSGATAHELGRERVTEIQRMRIQAAMVEECFARGIGNVTVAHVVQRAGVSRRTFYELFADCGDCFLAAFDAAFERASRYVLSAYDREAQWADRIRQALLASLSFLERERETGWLLVIGSLGAGPAVLERRQQGIIRMVALVDEGRTQAKTSAGLSPLTAETIVGGVLSVLYARLLDLDGDLSVELAGPLMSMIVLPYLGPAASRKELARPAPTSLGAHRSDRDRLRPEGNPLGDLEMRLTYRTVRVLMAIAAHPGSSNRLIAEASEVTDQGQMSKLLARLHDIDLIANTGGGAIRGEPNAWTLTDKGWRVQGAIAEQAPEG